MSYYQPPHINSLVENSSTHSHNVSSSSSSTKNAPREASKPKPKSSKTKIDPRQIPRPKPRKELYSSENQAKKLVFKTDQGNLPPSAAYPTEFHVIDTGNASPRFIRSTTSHIPADSEVVETSRIGIGAIIQPMTPLPLDENPLPVIDYGEDGPLRCSRCLSYVNPGYVFLDQGRKVQCNLCEMINDVPHDYISHLDGNGLRRDRNDRPELLLGSVEFVAPSDYSTGPPQNPCYLFVLDVSLNAIRTGLLESSVNAIKGFLPSVALPEKTRIGVVTYDSCLHFYRFCVENQEARMMIVSDVEDVFLPIPSHEMLVDMGNEQLMGMFERFLDGLSDIWRDNQRESSAFGAAITAANLLLQNSLQGGRILITMTRLPSKGIGALENREVYDGKGANITKSKEEELEKELLLPQDSYYQILAVKIAENSAVVDLFVASEGYCDLATIGALSRDTGGSIHFYPAFNTVKDGFTLETDVYRTIQRECGYCGIMAVRTSKGLNIDDHYGSFFRQEESLFTIPILDFDRSYAVKITHAESLQTSDKACIQAAVLYTTLEGERRIRVHTLQLPITDSLNVLYKQCDIDAIVNLSLRQDHKLSGARLSLINAVIDILYTYRKRCANTTSAGQLILPESLKLLPLYTLGIIKNSVLRDYCPSDERFSLFSLVECMPLTVSIPFCNPRVFALHLLTEGDCLPLEDGRIMLPELDLTSYDYFDSTGVYLVDQGLCMYIWVGDSANPSLLNDLFGCESLDGVDLYDLSVALSMYNSSYAAEEYDANSVVAKTMLLVDTLCNDRAGAVPLRILNSSVLHEEVLDEREFLSKLVEDEIGSDGREEGEVAPDAMSYVDFLCFVHKKIQDKFL